MSELFPIESVAKESPRLAWIKKHNIWTIHNSAVQIGDECPDSGETLYPWCASQGEFNGLNGAWGNTEDEALCEWAKAHNVKLWNEE